MRGFALDHGYDIGITMDGMNVNQPSHIHSNGYADTNFLIPELLSEFEVRKGPYFADEGVFSAVGAVHMNYIDKLREGLVIGSGGSFLYGRALGAKSWAVGQGELLMALELANYNGPWQRPDEARKINGFARWSEGTDGERLLAHGDGLFAALFCDGSDPLQSGLGRAHVALGHAGPDGRRQWRALQPIDALERDQ